MTAAELRAKWESRHDEWRRLGVHVDGSLIAAEVLADVAALEHDDAERLLSPAEASARTGYHPESISRMVRQGRVKNYGTKHRPRVKLSELPHRPAAQRRKPRRSTSPVAAHIGPDASSPHAIAREAIVGRIAQ